MKIVDIREETKFIKSNIRNAYIDFSKMTLSLVAVVTDVVRDGRPVIGYGFNSNGRYGQGSLIRERFRPRVLEAEPSSVLDDKRDNIDPHKVWAAMMSNEKPGGHGERSVAVGTIDMAVWDAVAKIEHKPLFHLLAERHGNGTPNRKVFVYAAGGYYWPGQGLEGLTREMRGLSRPRLLGGQEEDRRRLARRRHEAHRSGTQVARAGPEARRRRERPVRSQDRPSNTQRRSRSTTSSGTRKPATRSTTRCRPSLPSTTRSPWLRASLAIAAVLGLGGNESYPDLFQPYGGFPDGVKVENSYVTLPEIPGIGFEGKSDLIAEMRALAS